MGMNFQKTIKESIEFKGVGLHNGIKVNLCLKPAEVNSGIKMAISSVYNSGSDSEHIKLKGFLPR